MRKLPLVEQLRVAEPCAAEWAAMTGNDEARHCAHCKQNVYNLSELTRSQAEELIRSANARLCARYFHRADGTMLLRDGAVAYRPTRLIAASVTALALTGAAAMMARPSAPLPLAIDPPAASAPPAPIERDIHIAHEPPPPPPRKVRHVSPPPDDDRRIYHTGGVMVQLPDDDVLVTQGK